MPAGRGTPTVKELTLLASSPRKIRQTNEIAALRALHRADRLSRADLARILNLNRSSSGHIIAELTAAGLVREVNEEKAARQTYSRAGRPGVMLELVPDAVFFLGIEIGVEHITATEIDLRAAIIRTRSEPFDGPAHGVEEAVRHAIALACSDLSPDRLERCEGIGISTPSQLNLNGTIHSAPLLGWKNVNLIELVRQSLPFQIPLMVENDANAFAIGAGYGDRPIHAGVTLFVVMESGVGSGILVDGILFRGGHGLAGEIGHMQVEGAPAKGRNLEQIVGLTNILSEYRTVTGRREATFEDFLADVRDRVPEAVSIAENWAKALAYALVQTCRVIDADRIVLGGSVAQLYPLVAARLAAHMQAAQDMNFPLPNVQLNAEANFGPAFGAACMLHQRYLSLESNRFSEED
ncbi:MAG: sugar kinase [Rhizobiales bacterium 63-7]|nr:ROK family transcriptional regulator [Hyphomicrobiales bacterium]OJU66155.1 MAG: sugar kinase [Rhizobiales bacterium 63-7]